ncbi:MAG: FAD binding domain-containing protein [Candidatus Nanopelagicales bacterium]
MIPVAFDYVKAGSVDEAVAALAAGGEDAKVLGGGQSLMPVLRLRMNAPSVLVDVSQIDELRTVTDEGGSLLIGAGVTTYEVMHHDAIKAGAPLLSQAAGEVADPAIRHRGTFGGSCTHADPAGDLPTIARCLDAEFVIAGPGGRRTVGAGDFFVDYFTTAVGVDEVLVAIRVPKLGDGWGFDYQKFHRTAQAWAIVGAAAAVKVEGGTITEARVALTNMGRRPCVRRRSSPRSSAASATQEAISAAAQSAADGTSPTSDTHAQADFREHLARVLTARAVAKAAGTRPPAAPTAPCPPGRPPHVLGRVDLELGGLDRQPDPAALRGELQGRRRRPVSRRPSPWSSAHRDAHAVADGLDAVDDAVPHVARAALGLFRMQADRRSAELRPARRRRAIPFRGHVQDTAAAERDLAVRRSVRRGA